MPKYTKLVQVRNSYSPFEFKGFSTWGERETQFLSMLTFPSEPQHMRHPPQTTGLASASSENRLACSEFKSQLTQPTRGARSAQSRLASPRSEYQLTAFFQIPRILSDSGHDVIHVPGHFLSGVFIVTSLIVTSAPRAREHLHSTNPCTKRKVLSLTKPKGKIYETKNDNIKKIPPQLYYTMLDRILKRYCHLVRFAMKKLLGRHQSKRMRGYLKECLNSSTLTKRGTVKWEVPLVCFFVI